MQGSAVPTIWSLLSRFGKLLFALCCTQIRYCCYAHILHFFTATLTGSNHGSGSSTNMLEWESSSMVLGDLVSGGYADVSMSRIRSIMIGYQKWYESFWATIFSSTSTPLLGLRGTTLWQNINDGFILPANIALHLEIPVSIIRGLYYFPFWSIWSHILLIIIYLIACVMISIYSLLSRPKT